jgi:acetoin utilization deacetylase AcuC-like enzyme
MCLCVCARARVCVSVCARVCVCVRARWQALVVSLGFDTLGTDPEIVPGAGMALTPADFGAMGSMFRALPCPVLYLQEGGYDLVGIAAASKHLYGVA